MHRCMESINFCTKWVSLIMVPYLKQLKSELLHSVTKSFADNPSFLSIYSKLDSCTDCRDDFNSALTVWHGALSSMKVALFSGNHSFIFGKMQFYRT
jgi:hypothetical protein